MKKLSLRLQACAELVRGDIIADIGSDHAYLPVWLVKNNKIKKACAVDVSKKCVERIKNNLAKFNIAQEIIVPVLSDGLAELENIKFTDIIIAGMGAKTICDILKNIKDPADINFILQPNTKLEVLREFLTANNFKILDEIKVRDKKREYTIMRAAYAGKLF